MSTVNDRKATIFLVAASEDWVNNRLSWHSGATGSVPFRGVRTMLYGSRNLVDLIATMERDMAREVEATAARQRKIDQLRREVFALSVALGTISAGAVVGAAARSA